MDDLYLLLSILCFITLIIGIINPKIVIRGRNIKNKNRKMVLKIYGIGMILFFILFGINTPPTDQATESYERKESITNEISDVKTEDTEIETQQSSIVEDLEVEAENKYKEIKQTIENKDYLEAEQAIDQFLKSYPNSEYISLIKELNLTIEPELDKIKAELEEKKIYEEKLKNKITQTLINKDIEENIAVKILDLINEIKLPVWNTEDTLVVENSNEDDFMLSYSASDGDVSIIYAMHILEDDIVEIVDQNMEVVYDSNGLNSEYVFYNDIDVQGLIDHSKEIVKSVLKSPTTAKFSDTWIDPFNGWSVSKSKNIIELSSYVDSQNSFGAMIRSNFVLRFKKTAESYEGVYFKFDGKVLTNKE